MFKETLSDDTKKALAILSQHRIVPSVYLAGGTACALQIGHRISIDLDFFTPQKFDTKSAIQFLQKIGKFELEQESWGTILGEFEGVKLSLFVYEYPILFPFCHFENVILADIRDIAAMKVDAIGSRGLKRDFIDLYFICKQGLSLREVFLFYDKKYGTFASNRMHILKSLVYFEDAEVSPEPKMIKLADWEEIKSFFEHEIKNCGVT